MDNGSIAGIAIAAVIFAALLAFVLIARRGRRLHPRPPDDGTAVRGWMVLLAIGVTLSPVRLLASALSGFTDLDTLRSVPGGMTAFTVETTAITLLFALSVVVAVAFWGRRARFKPLFIVLWALLVTYALGDLVFVSFLFGIPIPALLDHDTVRNIAINLFAVVWVLYVLRSRRVAARFVR